MTTFRALAFIPAAVLLVAACGDNGKSTDSSDSTPATSVVTPDTITTTESTAMTSAPDAPSTTAVLPSSVEIEVIIGVDSGTDRVETVAVGTEVVLTVTSPDDDDEIHVHEIDLEQAVAAGESVTFTFVVDAVGPIEVESHVTHDVIVVIQVV